MENIMYMNSVGLKTAMLEAVDLSIIDAIQSNNAEVLTKKTQLITNNDLIQIALYTVAAACIAKVIYDLHQQYKEDNNLSYS